MQRTLQQGPWFINGYYLSVKRWHPNFVASQARENISAIWIRLPELLTDHSNLARVGKRLGKLVKTDVCTSSTLRGRYARIYVEVPMGVPVKNLFT
uniref:Putative ovule protein n=1 Tax=Solanum chacoense TaxID=4108 RepID=A0A0V0GZK1_SOLCH